jgi:hypothetical protein
MSDNPYQAPTPEKGSPKDNRTDAVIVKSIGVLSAGKVMACLYSALGLILGGFLSLFALAGAAVGGPNGGGANLILGVGSIIILPVMYGVLGFIGGIVMAALYNVVASFAGGIEIDLKPTLGDLG